MSRPARRTSALSAQSPITSTPAAAKTTEPEPTPGPDRPDTTEPKSRATNNKTAAKKTTRVGPYVTPAEADRIRAAYQFGYLREGAGSFTDFLAQTIMEKVELLEQRHNGGQPFSGAASRGVTKSLSQMAVEQRKRENRQPNQSQ